jgi:hypothetical protein
LRAGEDALGFAKLSLQFPLSTATLNHQLSSNSHPAIKDELSGTKDGTKRRFSSYHRG